MAAQNAQRWREIKEILENALEIPTENRAGFLAEKCADDADLRREVESYLAFETNDALDCASFGASANFIGENFGSYKIIKKIGEGGMGAVFLAERADGEFHRQVAVKIVRGGLASDAVLRRFLNERQILAELEHPNIARLIDGGTNRAGAPFFVLEYVDGLPVTEYAKKKDLSVSARLDLFRQICAAVQYAHKNLVIHRDLKPSNILITDACEPKLLDFGIAKILKQDGDETQTKQFAFTPDYASPEQKRGEKLTTATDVYSLGVILHELLTGNRPPNTENEKRKTKNEKSTNSNKHTAQDQRQRTKDQTPKTVSIELKNIVAKALCEEPERRYSSIEHFSEDVRRYLRGLPVAARPNSFSYRASKFISRNRLTFAAALVAFLFLLGGVAATINQAIVARRERARAEQRFNDVRKLANSFMFEINDEIVRSPIKARELLVQKAIEYLDKLAAEAGDDAELQSELAMAYEKIGNIQGEIFKPTTGKIGEALASYQKALELREKLFAAAPNAAGAINLSRSRLDIGGIYLTSGNLAAARANFRESINILELRLASEPENSALQNHFARSLSMNGQAAVRCGSLGEALENYEKSLKIYQHLAAASPEIVGLQRNVGILFSYIGFVKMETGKTAEAVGDYENWLETEKKINERDKNNLQSRGELSSAHIWFGAALSEHGDAPKAAAHFAEGIAILEAEWLADKENLGKEYTLADGHLEFGKALLKNNLAGEAIKNLEKAAQTYRKVWQKDKQNLMAHHRVAAAQRFLADAFLQTNNEAQAAENYAQSLAAFEELTAADSENVDWRQDLAMSYLRRGELSLKKNDAATARADFERALPIFEKLAAQSPENIKRDRELKTVQSYLAVFLAQE